MASVDATCGQRFCCINASRRPLTTVFFPKTDRPLPVLSPRNGDNDRWLEVHVGVIVHYRAKV